MLSDITVLARRDANLARKNARVLFPYRSFISLLWHKIIAKEGLSLRDQLAVLRDEILLLRDEI